MWIVKFLFKLFLLWCFMVLLVLGAAVTDNYNFCVPKDHALDFVFEECIVDGSEQTDKTQVD